MSLSQTLKIGAVTVPSGKIGPAFSADTGTFLTTPAGEALLRRAGMIAGK